MTHTCLSRMSCCAYSQHKQNIPNPTHIHYSPGRPAAQRIVIPSAGARHIAANHSGLNVCDHDVSQVMGCKHCLNGGYSWNIIQNQVLTTKPSNHRWESKQNKYFRHNKSAHTTLYDTSAFAHATPAQASEARSSNLTRPPTRRYATGHYKFGL